MNSIQQFVELAIKGDKNHWGTIGYGDTIGSDGSVSIPRSISYILLDPRAWRAVGKVKGWTTEMCRLCKQKNPTSTADHCDRGYYLGLSAYYPEYQDKMHRFIDLLADGKDINSALEEILK